MYKDFKKSESLDTGFVGGSGIIWMFSGVILGLLVGLGMYYFANNKTPVLSSVDAVQKKIASAQSKANSRAKTYLATSRNQLNRTVSTTSPVSVTGRPKQRHNNFSYYAVLPTIDVPVGNLKPVTPVKASLKAVAPDPITEKKVAILNAEDIQTKIEPTEDGGYLLQVASFKRKARANSTIRKLSAKGVSAYIQEKRVKGRTWFRVIAGPVGQNGLDSWKLKAEKLGHRPIILSGR